MSVQTQVGGAAGPGLFPAPPPPVCRPAAWLHPQHTPLSIPAAPGSAGWPTSGPGVLLEVGLGAARGSPPSWVGRSVGPRAMAPSDLCAHDRTEDRQEVPAQRLARGHLSSNSFLLCFQKHRPWQAGTTLKRAQSGSPSASARVLPEGRHGSPLASATRPHPGPVKFQPMDRLPATEAGALGGRSINQPPALSPGACPTHRWHLTHWPLPRGRAQQRGPGGEGGPPPARTEDLAVGTPASDNLQILRTARCLSRLPWA